MPRAEALTLYCRASPVDTRAKGTRSFLLGALVLSLPAS